MGAIRDWDPYSFILLNLALQAAYAAPVILMGQNRQQDIDREAADNDYRINVKAELEAVRMMTELLEEWASGARDSDAQGGGPS
ncbi:DUF1003 domain-containing protein [Bradyrhizobium sp. RDM12]